MRRFLPQHSNLEAIEKESKHFAPSAPGARQGFGWEDATALRGPFWIAPLASERVTQISPPGYFRWRSRAGAFPYGHSQTRANTRIESRKTRHLRSNSFHRYSSYDNTSVWHW